MLSLVQQFNRLVMSKSINKASNSKVVLPPFLESKRPKISPEIDYSTLSNYQSFHVNNTILDWEIDFNKKLVKGFITLNLTRLIDIEKSIKLDTSFLQIDKISINNEIIDNFEIKDRIEPLGSQLIIPLLNVGDSSFNLKIEYETTENCTALQWLHAKDGNPYVFSQLEAIHARSLFPCLDTPSIKSKYQVTIKSKLPVVFSGIEVDTHNDHDHDADVSDADVSDADLKKYRFKQDVPIPSYLIGIASGNLLSAEIGPRSKVYAEPHRIKDCQWEFNNDVEKFIKVAEKLIFNYEWGRYDILINVDSYPYGGMESPNVTFATPTLIAYDKSNIDVIAHELAHSWSGNLVTNCSWNHFWLNEGWTVYLERRIMSLVHDNDSIRHFSALIGWNDLQDSINAMKKPNRFSTLVQDLSDGCDPDEAFSSVPYEKGFNLLFHLETQLGGTKEFDPFIKYYFRIFAYKSLDTFQFLDTLFEFYSNDTDKLKILKSIDWETWLYKPGMPPRPNFDTTMADSVYKLAHEWVDKSLICTEMDEFKQFFHKDDIANFNSNQIVLFLETLVQLGHVSNPDHKIKWFEHQDALRALFEIYDDIKLVKSRNAEVIFKLFKLQLVGQTDEYYIKLADWLGTVGRMKFVRPGYRLLNSVDRSLALETFHKYQNSYHPICKSLVKQDLEITD